jgi:ferredoxin
MAVRVDPNFKHELIEFGLQNVDECFNCGNCTAICAHSEAEHALPRGMIRMMQLGMHTDIDHSIEPWLCYYCGDCSRTCPREANPAEHMMVLRRYLTSRYDWTGISKKLYLSAAWEVGMLLLVALVVVLLFVVGHMSSSLQIDTWRVDLQTFAPMEVVHFGDWALALFLLFFLGTNAIRMFTFTMGGMQGKIPLSLYITESWKFMLHLLTQVQWRKCTGATRWSKHLLIFIGYATMLLLVVGFLPIFQRQYNDWHWTSLFGYYATAMLLYASGDAILSRLRKKEEIHQYSHLSDWMYLILLFLTGLSGILLHLFRLINLPWPTYIMYVAHLAIAVPMLVVEVPFGKWAHLIYRPLAMYLVAVREKALELQHAKRPGTVTAVAR